jgi:hypothetical protein
MQSEIRAMQVKLGWPDDKLKAERKRSSNDRVLLHRMRSAWSVLCRRAERDSKAAWTEEEAKRREMVFQQQQAIAMADIANTRAIQSLPERLGAALGAMRLLEEGTRAAGYDPKVSGGDEQPIIRLAERPLADEWEEHAEGFVKAIERALDEARGIRAKETSEEREHRILSRKGPPLIVAVSEDCSETYVRKLRLRNNRVVESGEPRKVA